MLGDTQGAIADCTAVVDMKDAPGGQRASALFSRGVRKGVLGDAQGAIADYTAVVDMKDAPSELRAKALFNRGVSKGMLGDAQGAIADLQRVVELGLTQDDSLPDAAQLAFRLLWALERRAEADALLSRFAVVLKPVGKDKAREIMLRLLNSLALPGIAEAWVHAFRHLGKALATEVSEALESLEPVCAILEGKDRSLMNSLSPERREFAQFVLKRFEVVGEGRPGANPSPEEQATK
jgi:hypothetical protein